MRATDYSTSGYVTTWKVGATWEPIEDIRFRATRSRDIRAPNLNELFQAGTSRTNATDNPFTPQLGDVLTFLETTTGNLNLRPEKADSFSAGVVLQPRFLGGFSASADYFEVKVEDAIGQLFAGAIISRCFEGNQDFCRAFRPDPSGERDLLVSASPFNFSRQTVRGVDFEASYRLPIERLFANADGAFTLRGLATRYIDNITDTGFSIPVDSVGDNSGSGPPKWIYRFSASVDTPTYTITGTARGISSGTYGNNLIECQTNCPTGRPSAIVSQFPTIDDNSAPGLFYVDLNVTSKFNALGRGEGVLRQRHEPVQRGSIAAAGGRPFRQHHVQRPARPRLPRWRSTADALSRRGPPGASRARRSDEDQGLSAQEWLCVYRRVATCRAGNRTNRERRATTWNCRSNALSKQDVRCSSLRGLSEPAPSCV